MCSDNGSDAVRACAMHARNALDFVSLSGEDRALAFHWGDELLAKKRWPERGVLLVRGAQ